MKVLLAAGVAVILGATSANAKLTPMQRQAPADSPEVWAISTGPVGAMLEPGYLQPLNGTFAAQRIEQCQVSRNTIGGEIRITHRCY